MSFDVELEDGTIISDVPDGTTRSELMRRLGKASSSKASPPDSMEGKWYRGLGLGTRDLIEGAAKAVGVFSDPLAAFGNEALEAVGSESRMSTAGGVGKTISDAIGLPTPQNATERVISDINQAGAGVLTTVGAGTLPNVARSVSSFLTSDLAVQAGSAAGGALAGGVTRESGGGRAAQIAAGLAGGLAGGGAVSAFRSPADDAAALLLEPGNRQAALNTTDDELQDAVRQNYANATAPFNAQYQAVGGAASGQRNFNAVVGREANALSFDPAVGGAANRINRVIEERLDAGIPIDAGTMKDARSYLLGEARASKNPNSSRVLNAMAEGIQQDIDDALMSTAARDISARYADEVIGPYARIRQSLERSADPEEVWKSIKGAGRSDLERLANAIDPQARDVIRRRAIREIVDREEAFTGMQAGSGAPAFRQMDARGLGAFFTPREWAGLRRVTGRLAALKNPFTRIAAPGSAAVVGAIGAGPVGAVAGATGMALAEFLASTTRGRYMLERALRIPSKELDVTLMQLARNPGILHGLNATDSATEEN